MLYGNLIKQVNPNYFRQFLFGMIWCDLILTAAPCYFYMVTKLEKFVQPATKYGRPKMRQRFGGDGKRNDMPNDRHTSRRPKRRDPSETIQMSIRVDIKMYEKFRWFCELQRRTNGDMLRVLLESYGQTSAAAPSRPIEPISAQKLARKRP